jgi:antitoxin FitA
MATLTIRNLPEDLHRAFKVRAAQHGRSTEAEVREILIAAVQPEERVRIGDALSRIGGNLGLSNEDLEALDRLSDKTPAQPFKL